MARYVIDREPWLRRMARRERRIQLCLALPVAAVVVAGVWALLAEVEPEVGGGAGWLFGVMIAIPFMMYAVRGGAYAKHVKLIEAPLKPQPARELEEHSVELRPEGVLISNRLASWTTRWSAFDRVVHERGYVAILQHWQAKGVEIPEEAFASTEELGAFIAEARRLMSAAGVSQLQRVTAALADESLACGACGHDLLGNQSGVCPECGLELSVMSLSAWKSLASPWWKVIRAKRRGEDDEPDSPALTTQAPAQASEQPTGTAIAPEAGALTFAYPPDGHARIAAHVLATDPAAAIILRRERQIRLWSVVLFVFVMPVLAFAIIELLRIRRVEVFTAVSAVFGLSLVGQVWGTSYSVNHRKLRRLKSGRQIGRSHTISVSVTDGGLDVIDGHSDANIPWSSIAHIEIVNGGITFLYSAPFSGFLVPADAFRSPEELARFLGSARELFAASGRVAEGKVVKRLATLSVPCARCGHDLLGVPEARCPECGTRVTTLAFSAAEIGRVGAIKDMWRRLTWRRGETHVLLRSQDTD